LENDKVCPMHSLQKSAGWQLVGISLQERLQDRNFLDTRASSCPQRFAIMSGGEGTKVTLDKTCVEDPAFAATGLDGHLCPTQMRFLIISGLPRQWGFKIVATFEDSGE
jgi:hypothetical protein